MATRQADLLKLIARIRKVGWRVTMASVGDGYRVKCPDGTYVNIHMTPSDVNHLAVVTRELNRRGFATAEKELKAREEQERKAKIAAAQERNAARTVKAAKASAALAKAAGPYATPDVTIGQILAQHPSPIVWLKVHVTPAMATAMLDRNTHNRRESSGEQKDWESKLRQGRALHTHQGIAFDVLGRLLDGQTRLRTIEATGVGADLMVSAGWPVANFAVADTGRRRTPAQVLQMEGTTSASWISPAARLLHLYGAWGHLTLDHTKDRVGNDQILDVVGKVDRDDMAEAVRVAGQLRGQIRRVPPGGVIAAIYVIRQALRPDYEAADEFAGRLVHGIAEVDDPMVHALRRRLIRASTSPKERLTSGEIMALCLKAWNARIDGRHTAHLQIREGSTMPAPRTPGEER